LRLIHVEEKVPRIYSQNILRPRSKICFFYNHIQLNASMPKIGMKVLLYAGIPHFYHFEICDGKIIMHSCFKNLILVERFFVNRYPASFFSLFPTILQNLHNSTLMQIWEANVQKMKTAQVTTYMYMVHVHKFLEKWSWWSNLIYS
jgi:hypothetical protein